MQIKFKIAKTVLKTICISSEKQKTQWVMGYGVYLPYDHDDPKRHNDSHPPPNEVNIYTNPIINNTS